LANTERNPADPLELACHQSVLQFTFISPACSPVCALRCIAEVRQSGGP